MQTASDVVGLKPAWRGRHALAETALARTVPIGVLVMPADAHSYHRESNISLLDEAFDFNPIEARIRGDKTASILPVVILRRIGFDVIQCPVWLFPTRGNAIPPSLP